MPHARLSQISLEHAKTTGLLMAEVHKLRASGVPAASMVGIGTIEGLAAQLSDLNAEIGTIALSVSEDAAADAKDAGGTGKNAAKTGA